LIPASQVGNGKELVKLPWISDASLQIMQKLNRLQVILRIEKLEDLLEVVIC
jgi:hypothetical protein